MLLSSTLCLIRNKILGQKTKLGRSSNCELKDFELKDFETLRMGLLICLFLVTN